jgi:hypothetical protein
VKFSSWRLASLFHAYGPALTTIQSGSSNSGMSGSAYRGSSIAIQMCP